MLKNLEKNVLVSVSTVSIYSEFLGYAAISTYVYLRRLAFVSKLSAIIWNDPPEINFWIFRKIYEQFRYFWNFQWKTIIA